MAAIDDSSDVSALGVDHRGGRCRGGTWRPSRPGDWRGRVALAQPEWRSKGKWIIPTNKPTRFGLKVMAFNPIPAPDPATWTLQIGGLVEEPITLNAADIDKLPKVAQNSRLKCVQCWSGRVNWVGFRPRTLLTRTRVKAESGWVKVECADKYYDFVKLEDLFNERTHLRASA